MMLFEAILWTNVCDIRYLSIAIQILSRTEIPLCSTLSATPGRLLAWRGVQRSLSHLKWLPALSGLSVSRANDISIDSVQPPLRRARTAFRELQEHVKRRPFYE